MTITPGEFNDFVIYQGGTWSYTLTWTDTSGNLIDLTGYTAELKARYELDNATAAIDLSTSNGGITLGGTAGTIDVVMSATATASLIPGPLYYDLKLISSAQSAYFLINGTLLVQQMATR